MFNPPVVRNVVSRRFCMKVDHCVVPGVCHWSQFTNEVEYSLIQVELCVEKPLANDHHPEENEKHLELKCDSHWGKKSAIYPKILIFKI